jgi:hypothetical protein
MNKLPDISDWPERVSDERLPLGMTTDLPVRRDELRQGVARLKKLLAFRASANATTLADYLKSPEQMMPGIH